MAWAGCVGRAITVGLKSKPVVLLKTTLSVRATGRQWRLDQHNRLELWIDSVGLLNTAGLSQEPTLLKQPSLSVGPTNRQCCSTGHCRVESRTDTVACRSVSVLGTGSNVNPPSLPLCHYRFKIRQWRDFLNRHWCPDLGSVSKSGKVNREIEYAL
jgi:hypothetical protein